jgi:acetyl esterase/lipase
MSIREKLINVYWRGIEKKDGARMQHQSPAEKVTMICDIPYIENAEVSNYLDIYYPVGTEGLLPVIFEVHGGGWFYGNKELNKFYATDLATRGFTIVNVNYHLAGLKRFPEQLKDIFAALDWLKANGDKYHCDLKNVFITGDSAGGHLTSLTMALQNNQEARALIGISEGVPIKAGGLVCGVYDLEEFGKLNFITRAYAKVMLGEKLKSSKYRNLMSFMKTYNGKMPPLYLVSSEEDLFHSQTLIMAEFCKKQGIEHTLHYWKKGSKNKLEHVFNVIYPAYEESIATNDEMCDFFRKYIS